MTRVNRKTSRAEADITASLDKRTAAGGPSQAASSEAPHYSLREEFCHEVG
jgi:hypothetical protein